MVVLEGLVGRPLLERATRVRKLDTLRVTVQTTPLVAVVGLPGTRELALRVACPGITLLLVQMLLKREAARTVRGLAIRVGRLDTWRVIVLLNTAALLRVVVGSDPRRFSKVLFFGVCGCECVCVSVSAVAKCKGDGGGAGEKNAKKEVGRE